MTLRKIAVAVLGFFDLTHRDRYLGPNPTYYAPA